jgi:O-antigen ligase
MTAATSWPLPESLPRSAPILKVLLSAYVVFLPYQFQTGDGINFAPADCFLLLLVVLAAGQLKYRREAWSIWHFGIMLTFVAGSLVTAVRFGAIMRYELINKDLGLFLPFLSYAAVTSWVAEWDDLRYLMRLFALSVVIQNALMVALFLASYFFGISNPFARYGGLRLAGMLLDPNAYGGLLVMTLVLIVGASNGPEPLLSKAMLVTSRVTLVPGILFTFSRSAWSALGLAMLVFAVLRPRAAARFVLAGLLCAPGILLLLGRRFVPIFQTMASRPKQVQGRFDLIHDALEAFSRHPLFGGGIGAFRLGEGSIAHNSAMWFLADFGIIGLTAFAGFLGWFFLKGWSAYQSAPASKRSLTLAALLAHTAMLGLAMGIEAFYQRHWWLALGMIASGYSLTLRRSAAGGANAEDAEDYSDAQSR